MRWVASDVRYIKYERLKTFAQAERAQHTPTHVHERSTGTLGRGDSLDLMTAMDLRKQRVTQRRQRCLMYSTLLLLLVTVILALAAATRPRGHASR